MMRKNTLTAIALAITASTIAVTPAFAFDADFNPGDLILGVQSSSSTASVLEVNLGAPLAIKDAFNSGSNLYLGNIGAELTSLYGTNWYDDSSVFFGVAGSRSATAAAGTADANGDFNSTVYASRARLGNGTVATPNSAAWTIGTTAVSQAATSIIQAGNTFNGSSPTGVAIKTIGTSAPNDWSDLNPVSGSTQGVGFSAFVGGIQYNFASGSFDDGAFGGLTGVEGVIDLYRIARFSNAIPGQPNPTPGVGSFLGSLAITQSGDVHFITAVPEPNSALLVGLASLAGLCIRRRLAVTA